MWFSEISGRWRKEGTEEKEVEGWSEMEGRCDVERFEIDEETERGREGKDKDVEKRIEV